MPPIVLKLEGNESFFPFTNLDGEELSKTWRVCTKVKDSLENGSRLENLSWRLWFIQNVLYSNDVKAKKKKMEDAAAAALAIQKNETPESVLDYSLDEIKPMGTENFILNQFTSDQEGDLMIELQDIFPSGMQDFMYSLPPGNNTNNAMYSSTSPWQPGIKPTPQQQQQQQQQQQALPQSYNTASTTAPGQFSHVPVESYIDPISGMHSLLSDPMDIPSMTMPADMNSLQQPVLMDFNNPAYVAAAAAATAAALTTIPNATLHNKLLATLPPQTLASAERLLSPANRRPSVIPPPQRTNRANIMEHQQQQQHYYNTFQVSSPTDNKRKAPTAANCSSMSNNNDSPSEEKSPVCSNCEATSTPLWRRSADDKILCNACGLYLKLHNAPRPKHIKSPSKRTDNEDMDTSDDHHHHSSISASTSSSSSSSSSSVASAPATTTKTAAIPSSSSSSTTTTSPSQTTQQKTVCSNCGTVKTPLWRRDLEGAPLCNACGLYLKLHNEKRPLSMKTDVIKKRQRTEALLASTVVSEDQLKKPRYFDQQSLYSATEKGRKLGYRYAASTLPGTGILMMTPNNSSSGNNGGSAPHS